MEHGSDCQSNFGLFLKKSNGSKTDGKNKSPPPGVRGLLWYEYHYYFLKVQKC
jgi:hypothetical protein